MILSPATRAQAELLLRKRRAARYAPGSKAAKQQAAAEKAAQAARSGLLDFTTYTRPKYRVNWHHAALAGYLDRFAAGQIKRLIITAPPRTGKTELVSRRLPAFLFGKDPDLKVIACSHTQDFAQGLNRDVQRVILSPEYAALFPGVTLTQKNQATVGAGDWKRSADEFEIVGHLGSYKCAGVGGAITGRGGDFLLVDDPIKSREDADSPVRRARLWEWFQDDLMTRLDGDGGVLVMATRWHDDDLTGRLIARMASDPDADQFTVVNFPARLDDEADRNEHDERALGDPLWPWFYAGKRDGLSPQEELQAARDRLRKWEHGNPRGFSSLGQQRPVAKSGGLILVDKIEIVDRPPVARSESVRYWDKGGTEGGGTFTAGVKMSALTDGRWLIDHVSRGQWSALNRENAIKAQAKLDGEDVEVYVEQEPGSGGKESAEATIRGLPGFRAYADRPHGDKATRAEPFAAQVEAGNVLMIRGPWNQAYIDELRSFPLGKYRDQGDATSGAFNKIAENSSFELQQVQVRGI